MEKGRRPDQDDAPGQRKKIVDQFRISGDKIREPLRSLEGLHFAESDEDDPGLGSFAVIGDAPGLRIAGLRVEVHRPGLQIDGVALPRETPPAQPKVRVGEMKSGLEIAVPVEIDDLGSAHPGDRFAGAGSEAYPILLQGKRRHEFVHLGEAAADHGEILVCRIDGESESRKDNDTQKC